jgi:threonylcarbamoyladenosine tRNA methylthiotransferase MtaB
MVERLKASVIASPGRDNADCGRGRSEGCAAAHSDGAIPPSQGRGEGAVHGPRIVSFGCRLNAFEAEAMRHRAAEAGLDDAIIVNTCAVTAEAVRQGAQAIRRLRRENAHAQLIVTGCAAQIDPARFIAMPQVDHVIGNAEKMLPEAFDNLGSRGTPRVAVGDIDSPRASPPVPARRPGSCARAYAQIQNGCDHRCTFCIIPYARGPSRSVPARDVVAQVRRLVEAGYAEIVLTGVDITAYGEDLPERYSLGSLVRLILRQVPELGRLRLSSVDQMEADPELLRAIAEEPRLMPHLHLSLQAGDDIILKRMKRRHLRADAIGFCREARRRRPDIAFGADLIAGFPTETEAMFTSSLSLIDDCGLSFLHVFPYSSRPGTAAARMPQVPQAAIKERARRLRQKGADALAAHLRVQIGRDVALLMERERLGRTPHFAEMELEPSAPPGHVVMARVVASDGRRLHGRPLAPMSAS